MKQIGKTIRLIREIAGVRQGELARKINVSANYISLVENQKREPSLKLIQKVATEFKVPMSVFFWEDVSTEHLENTDSHKTATEINKLYWDLIRSLLSERRT